MEDTWGLPYTDKDYEGEFNLLQNEKDFLKEAIVKIEGRVTKTVDGEKLSNLQGTTMSLRRVWRQIKRHKLEDFVSQVRTDARA